MVHGGLLALELTRQLEALGQTVEWLGLFDSTFHAEDEALAWDALYATVQRELSSDSRQRLATLAPEPLTQLRAATAKLDRVAQLRFALLQWTLANGLSLNAPLAYVEQVLDVMADARRWVNGYSVPTVQATLHLWWAEQTLVERPSLPAQWDAISQRTCHHQVAADLTRSSGSLPSMNNSTSRWLWPRRKPSHEPDSLSLPPIGTPAGIGFHQRRPGRPGERRAGDPDQPWVGQPASVAGTGPWVLRAVCGHVAVQTLLRNCRCCI